MKYLDAADQSGAEATAIQTLRACHAQAKLAKRLDCVRFIAAIACQNVNQPFLISAQECCLKLEAGQQSTAGIASNNEIRGTARFTAYQLWGVMKNPLIYEALAVILGIVGAFVLVSGLLPFINPGFLDANKTGDYSPRTIFLTGILFSLPLLGMCWHFNKKAQATRRALASPAPVAETKREKNLKWIFCGIVILLVLFAFLW